MHSRERAGGRGVRSEAYPALLVQRRRVGRPHSLAGNHTCKPDRGVCLNATGKNATDHMTFCERHLNLRTGDGTPDREGTCLWLSELRPRRSAGCHHRLPVCVPPAVLPLVLPPRVRGRGGGLVRGDHRGCGFGLAMDTKTFD